MTKPPETHAEAPAVAAKHGGRLLPPARYRHPGDVIRLIIAGLVLAGAAGGYRRRPCHVCGCQRCCGDRCCAFHGGGPGAGRARAGCLRRRGRRRGSRHVALPPVPAAGQPGGRRRIGGRRADRDRLARGRGCVHALSRPVPANGRGLPARRWRARRFWPPRWPARSPPRRGSAVRGGAPPGSHCGWPPLRG